MVTFLFSYLLRYLINMPGEAQIHVFADQTHWAPWIMHVSGM
jgi:hypothetical protein